MTCSVAESAVRPSSARFPLRSALAWAACLAVVAGLGCASTTPTATGGAPLAALEAERLLNPRLSPDYSQWLLGPVSALASAEEERSYLALASDEEARAFIADFWQRRNPYPERPDNALLNEFERRAAEADRLYSEGGRAGSKTARGTIYVLFGEPDRTDYEIARDPRDPPIEVWFYDGEGEPGLHGRPPGPSYRFIKRDRLTAFYLPRTGIERARPIRPEDY